MYIKHVDCAEPVERLVIYMYEYGWGDFFLIIFLRCSDSLIPMKEIYTKVIPKLKWRTLSTQASVASMSYPPKLRNGRGTLRAVTLLVERSLHPLRHMRVVSFPPHAHDSL